MWCNGVMHSMIMRWHSTRKFSAMAGCAAVVVLLMTADPAAAARIRHTPCPLDTTKVETAMESAAELAALNKRVDDAFQSLQRLSRGLDQRTLRNVFRADWVCEVERQCGRYDSGDTRLSRCLQDALRLRALDLESQLKARLESQ
jgi:hypothetical protein